jgi:signal transduction histidine kinase
MTDGPDLPPPAGRTSRDWAVDSVLFCATAFLGMVVLGVVREQGDLPGWASELDPLLGLVACLALWWRRRFPLAVTLLGLPAVALASSALPAGAVIVTNLAVRVRWRPALLVLSAYVVFMVPSGPLLFGADDNLWFDAAFSSAYLLTAFALGNAVRSRRLLVERQTIAREMHDVLAHRISLLSVHAGALAYRTRQAKAGKGPALSSAEVAESAEVIRGNAHEAVEELQEVLSLLRAEDGDEQVSLLPRIEDIDGLVSDARATGQPVDFRTELTADAVHELRPQLHRTVYRVAQEGLTNARKHAPGAPVGLRLTGGPGNGLTVEVRNELPGSSHTGESIPGTGAGLTGLAERVRLDGGTLGHTAADGTFTLRVRLPWPPR